VVGVAQLV